MGCIFCSIWERNIHILISFFLPHIIKKLPKKRGSYLQCSWIDKTYDLNNVVIIFLFFLWQFFLHSSGKSIPQLITTQSFNSLGMEGMAVLQATFLVWRCPSVLGWDGMGTIYSVAAPAQNSAKQTKLVHAEMCPGVLPQSLSLHQLPVCTHQMLKKSCPESHAGFMPISVPKTE